jgi:fucose permease
MHSDFPNLFSPRVSRLQHASVPLLFFLLGMVMATWSARIPAVRDAAHLNPAQLGIVLLGGGIGAVLAFPLAAWQIAHYGARRAALYSGLALLLLLPLLAFVSSMLLLVVAMGLFGAAISCFDVAVNAVSAEVERAAGRSMMSLLHAWFCVGTFAGALFGSVMAGIHITPLLHFGIVAIVLLLPLWMGFHVLPCDRPDPSAGKKHFALPHGPLVALGIICFCGAVAEGSIADWSGVFMRDQLGATESVAPLAFAAFSLLMLGARLIGDRLKDRFGARRLVAITTLIAASGIFIAVFASNVPLAIAGFALTGLGLAGVFPFTFSAAGQHGATALAAVATMGYSGGLIGPPVIGFIANTFGLQAALGFIGLLGVAIAIAAGRASLLK